MRSASFFAILLSSPLFAHAGTYSDDLFARALANDSTAPDYVLITVVDPQTHTKRPVCTTANLFLGAIHCEHGPGYTEAEIKAIALKQRDRIFVFARKAALHNLADYATPQALADVRKIFASKSDLELLERTFIESLTVMRRNIPYKEAVAHHMAYRDAVARALLERGIGCTMGDHGDALTPHR